MSHGNKPKGKSSGSTPAAGKKAGKVGYSDFRFVRIELLDKEKEEFRSLLAAGEFDHVSVDDFIQEGYKVTFVGQDGGNTALCSISQPNDNHHNAGLILTGRGRDSATAVRVCYYKDKYLCDDGLWREAEARRGGQYDDVG